jgi:hypothetical protein
MYSQPHYAFESTQPLTGKRTRSPPRKTRAGRSALKGNDLTVTCEQIFVESEGNSMSQNACYMEPLGTRESVADWGIMLHEGGSCVRFPIKSVFFLIYNLHNLSSRTTVLGLTQPPTEISTKNLTGDSRRPDAP